MSASAIFMRPALSALRSYLSILALVCLLPAGVQAQEDTAFDPISAGALLDEVVAMLEAAPEDAEVLDQVRSTAAQVAAAAGTCNATWTDERGRLEDRYAPLAEVTGDVAPTVFDQRIEVRALLDDAIANQTACAGIEDDAAALIERVTAIQNQLSQRFLSYRGDSIVEAARQFPDRMQALAALAKSADELEFADGLDPVRLLMALFASGLVAAGIGVFLRQRFQAWYERAIRKDKTPKLRYLFPKPLAEHSPVLLTGLAFLAVLYTGVLTASLDLVVVRVSLGILLVGASWVVIDWATGPLSPAASVKGLIPDHVRPLRIRLRLVALTLVASFVVLGTNWLTIRLIGPEVAGRALMIFLVACSLLYVNLYLGRIPGIRYRFRLLRAAATLGLLVGIVAVLVGYQNFAGYLIHGVTRSALALFVLWLFVWLVSTGLKSLRHEDSRDPSVLRQALGANGEVSRSAIGIMQLVSDLVLWLSVIVYLIYVWDESGTTLEQLIDLVVRGGTVGTIRLVPAQIIGGILVFAALLIVIGWIKRWIDRRWLQHIVMERGAREALITLFGYVAFIVALLVGLTQAGVDLGGLAIVSGALALGIGFGLQEIANNFVSGLILLFERPIRSGDFVTVGDIEGFVRKISIRATEIETLDNQNVLVPNSELVSGRVTNWVLRDPHGRIRLLVGVAYGSDVEKVRDILQDVACRHPEVITDGRAPAPRALFMGFGDSSLNFELRCRINRIDRRFAVSSDLNFEIDAEFRKAGIIIPFPQRDLHIVSYPEAAPIEAPQPAREPVEETVVRVSQPDPVTRHHEEAISVSAGIDECWATFIDGEKLSQWLGGEIEIAAYIGGAYRWSIPDAGDVRGRIDMFIPPQRMRLMQMPREGEEPLPTGPITITFSLSEDDGRTTIRVMVSGIPATEEWEEDYNRSQTFWRNALVDLAEMLTRK